MPLGRRSFLKSVGSGLLLAAAAPVLAELEPVRRIWQVSRRAPVGERIQLVDTGPLEPLFHGANPLEHGYTYTPRTAFDLEPMVTGRIIDRDGEKVVQRYEYGMSHERGEWFDVDSDDHELHVERYAEARAIHEQSLRKSQAYATAADKHHKEMAQNILEGLQQYAGTQTPEKRMFRDHAPLPQSQAQASGNEARLYGPLSEQVRLHLERMRKYAKEGDEVVFIDDRGNRHSSRLYMEPGSYHTAMITGIADPEART